LTEKTSQIVEELGRVQTKRFIRLFIRLKPPEIANPLILLVGAA